MRSKAPPLAPVFRSRHQAELLARLLMHPDQEFTLTALARQLGVSLTTLHGEVDRLTLAGILESRSVGRSRVIRAAPNHRLTRPLTDLLLVTLGPLPIAEEEFAGIPGIRTILIFGSWAARYAGEPGPAPNDIDLLIIGTPRRESVYQAADRMETRLGFPVNPTVVRLERWRKAEDALIQDIRSGPTATVLHGEDSGDAVEQR